MTEPLSKARAIVLVAGFGCILVGVFLCDFTHGTYGDFLKKRQPDTRGLLTGSFARAADRWLETNSWTMRASRPFWNESMLGLFRETSGNVVAGRDRWLFNDAALRPLNMTMAIQKAGAVGGMILRTMNRWAPGPDARHVVLVVPAKWRLHEDKLLGPSVHPSRRALYSRILQSLRSRGLQAPDVLDAMLGRVQIQPELEIFTNNDTHVSQTGLAFMVRTWVAPVLGVTDEHAAALISGLPTIQESRTGNLPALLSIRPESLVGGLYSTESLRYLVEPAEDDPDAETLLLGDSHTYYHDDLLQTLISTVSQRAIRGAHEGWAGWASLRASKPTPGGTAPRFFIFIINESGMLQTGERLMRKDSR